MSKRKKYGNIYEIKMPNNKYAYLCLIRECGFCIFDYSSEIQTNNIQELLIKGLKIYKFGKETAINKKIWTLVGYVDLQKENIKWPDLAIFMPHNKLRFIKESKIMSVNEGIVKVKTDEYLSLVKKGYINAFFDDYRYFELWLSNNIENYPEGENIFPLPEGYN